MIITASYDGSIRSFSSEGCAPINTYLDESDPTPATLRTLDAVVVNGDTTFAVVGGGDQVVKVGTVQGCIESWEAYAT